MNPTGQPVQLKPNYKILGILAIIGLVFFLFTQVFPITPSDTLETEQTASITSQQAIQKAETFQSSLPLSEQERSNLGTPSVTYVTNPELSGYIAREKLGSDYSKSVEKLAPYDVFRVHYSNPQHSVDIDVHMNTGNVVGFKIGQMSKSLTDLTTDSPSNNDGSLTLSEKEELAHPLLLTLGYDPSKLKLQSTEDQPGLDYIVDGASIGEAQLHLKLAFDENQVASLEPVLTPPSSYTSYIKSQTNLAIWLTIGGYGFFTLVLGVLAIVFASIKRRHTSFKRGILLSIIYFAVSIISVVNMWPYLERLYGGNSYGEVILLVMVALQLVLNVLMAVLLYFSLVGGDALWRERGMNMWPRLHEKGYGKYVLHSAAIGYLFAIILLGVQSVIYLLLENSLGVFSSSDDSSSPYNMVIPVLLPLLAWMAGIGEEGVYRLFGIGMLKKLLRNTFVASALTSIIWALGHTLYPIYPVYSRPIELLIIGLLFSLVFLRYGFIAAVFAHVMFDTILMSFSLMLTGGASNVAFGIFYIIMPAIIAYLIYLYARNKGVDNAYPPYTPPQQPYAPFPGAVPEGEQPYYRPDLPPPSNVPNDPQRFRMYEEPQQGQSQPSHPQQSEQQSSQTPYDGHSIQQGTPAVPQQPTEPSVQAESPSTPMQPPVEPYTPNLQKPVTPTENESTTKPSEQDDSTTQRNDSDPLDKDDDPYRKP
ncbi:CPBP family intramembrane glutamate endopeptidase [Paenibacillus kandeliae]|uniref:CPBP family intramembrane glutamate endopeptidase n=1 Tax=Paenibacillus kandeliae TaxID=3231269 RepID=UPI00345839D0